MKEHNYALQNADKTFEGIRYSLLATLKFEYG